LALVHWVLAPELVNHWLLVPLLPVIDTLLMLYVDPVAPIIVPEYPDMGNVAVVALVIGKVIF
jgi:hypothetical protein